MIKKNKNAIVKTRHLITTRKVSFNEYPNFARKMEFMANTPLSLRTLILRLSKQICSWNGEGFGCTILLVATRLISLKYGQLLQDIGFFPIKKRNNITCPPGHLEGGFYRINKQKCSGFAGAFLRIKGSTNTASPKRSR